MTKRQTWQHREVLAMISRGSLTRFSVVGNEVMAMNRLHFRSDRRVELIPTTRWALTRFLFTSSRGDLFRTVFGQWKKNCLSNPLLSLASNPIFYCVNGEIKTQRQRKMEITVCLSNLRQLLFAGKMRSLFLWSWKVTVRSRWEIVELDMKVDNSQRSSTYMKTVG